MTQPTKAIFPVTLEDFRRIISDFKGEKSLISNEDIQNCLRKIDTIELFEEKIINKKIKLTCFYAGHVLGAAMFNVEVNGFSVTYTGDYNTVVDRHLNGAFLPKLSPNVLITETTYGDTIRDTKRAREREFIKKITEVLNKGGKILIPIFALGRAQEICILLDTHWKRNKITVPIYFYGAMSEKSNFYYKIFNNWTNERIKSVFLEHNVFNFDHIMSNTKSKQNEAYKNADTPMIILATPGMLHAGTSLNIFKEICTDERNCVIIPGYCTSGTVGNKILSGEKQVEIDKKLYNVKCEVYYMSFSAHADAKGLISLIKNSNPTNLILVHGDSEVMKTFKTTVGSILPSINTYMPENYKEITFNEKIIYKQISFSKHFYDLIKYCYINKIKSLQNQSLISNTLNKCFVLQNTLKPTFKLKKFFQSSSPIITSIISVKVNSQFNIIIDLFIEFLQKYFNYEYNMFRRLTEVSILEIKQNEDFIVLKVKTSLKNNELYLNDISVLVKRLREFLIALDNINEIK